MEQFSSANGEQGAVGAEPDCGDGFFKGDTVENDAAGEIDELASVPVVDGEKEISVRRDGDAGNVGGGLCRESVGLGFEEIGDGDAVADGGDEECVVRNDDVSTSVRSSEEVLEPEIHVFWRRTSMVVAMEHSGS